MKKRFRTLGIGLLAVWLSFGICSGTAAFSEAWDEDIDEVAQEQVELMEPVVKAYCRFFQNFGLRDQAKLFDRSKDKDGGAFWTLFGYYAGLDSDHVLRKSGRWYTTSQVKEAAYALLADFDGKVPARTPDRWTDGTAKYCFPASDEGADLVELVDGSLEVYDELVDCYFNYKVWNGAVYHLEGIYHVVFAENDHVNWAASHPLPYSVSLFSNPAEEEFDDEDEWDTQTEIDLGKMEYLLRGYCTFGSYWFEGEEGEYFPDPWNEEIFWGLMRYVAKYDWEAPAQGGAKRYTKQRLQNLGYALFEDFDGDIPAIPRDLSRDGCVKKSQGDYIVTPEECQSAEWEMTGYVVQEDGSIWVSCEVSMWGVDEPEQYAFLLKPAALYVEGDGSFPLTVSLFRIGQWVMEAGVYEEPEVYVEADIPVMNVVGDEEWDSYILPQSSTRYLRESDLAGLSKAQLRLARNEIYARHGRAFVSEDLRAYFTAKGWYQEKYSAAEFPEWTLNAYERANIEFILSHEE